MRADRLVATLLLMQARGRVTARELATELEVSVATSRRDLEALSAAGIPVYPQPGRGGGWALLGGARTDLSGLTAAETQALFLLVGPAASVSPSARSALRKLVRALPETFRADAERAASAVVVDPERWGENEGRRSPGIIAALQDAVVQRRKVRISYTDAARHPSERLVEPLGLVDKNETWYLVAETPDGQRTFRIDRITDLAITEQASEAAAEFDLPAAWRKVVDDVERRRSTLTATVSVATPFLGVLRKQFGRHVEVVETLGDGRTIARVAAPTALDIARHLAGWGGELEVLGPDSVLEELRRIGRELTRLYS